MEIRKKLIIACAALAIVPLLVASIFLGYLAVSKSSEAIEDAASRQLISISNIKKDQIESYFNTIKSQVLTLSSSTMIVEAMSQFKVDFKKMGQEADVDQMRIELASYYSDQFAVEYSKRNNGASANPLQLLSQMDDESITLQYYYIQDNAYPLGNKHNLDAASDGSSYSELHGRYHPPIRDFLDKFGFYDIFLVDNESGDIVYSVFKEMDYTTSLLDGPYANTGIGEAFRAVYKADKRDTVLTDFDAYKPSYDAPASFMATPIFKNNKNIGVLIFQMPIDRINALMTSNEKWQDVGMGVSGETYLVGEDKTLRSQSRFLIEDKPAYLSALKKAGVSAKVINLIDSKNTSIGLQKVDNSSVSQALSGISGYHIIQDYRDVAVLSAFAPVNILGKAWGIIAEIDEQEAFNAKNELASSIQTSTVIICLIIAVIALAIGSYVALSITRPIIALSGVMTDVEMNNNLTLRGTNHSNDEIGKMATAFNSMLEKFQMLIQQVSNSSIQLATASEEVSAVASDSSSNINKQRAETEQVATAMNEMSATVQEVARNAVSAADAANKANEEASDGKGLAEIAANTIQKLANDIDEAAVAVRELESHSDSIGSVLDVIKGIADQTNLLALNAAIEAARAGEQGRGFAVVADEVRTLASRTQVSTQEIQEMIEKLQSGSKQAVSVMELGRTQAQTGATQATDAAQSLVKITTAVATINDMNTQIASAAEEQSLVTEEMNRNIININHASEHAADGATQTTSASEELARLASGLQELIGQFRV